MGEVARIYSGREKLKQGCKYEVISPGSQGPVDQVVHLIYTTMQCERNQNYCELAAF
jgi:hypothetical protein